MEGGSLTLAGPLMVNGNTVAPGQGGPGAFDSGGNGQAFGSGFFLQGNGTLAFVPGAGQTQYVSDVIADQSGNGGSVVNGTDGSWSLLKRGAGTLVLANSSNSYTGATTLDAGT